MANEVLDENHIMIHGWMRNKLRLKSNDLLIYSLIYGFSQDGESWFHGSRTYISKWFDISYPTVDKSLESLENRNLIIKKQEVVNGVKLNRYKANLEILQNFIPPKESLLPPKESLYNNNNDNNIILHDILNTSKDIFNTSHNIIEEPSSSSAKNNSQNLFTKQKITNPEKKNYSNGLQSLFNDIERLPDIRELKDAMKGWVETVYKKYPMSKAQFTISYQYLNSELKSDAEKIEVLNYAIMSGYQNLQWAKNSIDEKRRKVDFLHPGRGREELNRIQSELRCPEGNPNEIVDRGF